MDDNNNNDVILAAVAWWASKRPVEWDKEKHLSNPRINTTTPAESDLAAAVAKLLTPQVPVCGVCGTTKDVKWVGGSNPYKCPSPDCVSF